MSAQEHLNGQQFMGVKRMGNLMSGDFSVPMREVTEQDVGQPNVGFTHTDSQGWHNTEPSQQKLNASVRKEGVREPIRIGGFGDQPPSVVNGHHRYVAARRAGTEKVPVEFGYGTTPNDVANYVGHYTPPDKP